MYDELVKRLRAAAIMSDALSVFLPHSEGSSVAKLYNEAADAIEELSKRMDESIPKSDAEIIIEELSKPRWIPVTERLPEARDHVLVYAGFFQPFNEVSYIDAEGKWRFAYDDTEVPIVTHWMPLPQQPEEE